MNAAQLGEFGPLRQAMTLLRGYGLQVWPFFQDLSQLQRLYPKDWRTIFNNAGVFQLFGVANHLMAKECADLIGDIDADMLRAMAPEPADRRRLGPEGDSRPACRTISKTPRSRACGIRTRCSKIRAKPRRRSRLRLGASDNPFRHPGQRIALIRDDGQRKTPPRLLSAASLYLRRKKKLTSSSQPSSWRAPSSRPPPASSRASFSLLPFSKLPS